MVLAERYRLVRKHEDLGTGEFWGGVDQETGSEVWVCFCAQPGLSRIAEQMREWGAPAVPRILDSGEIRLILDSRTMGVTGAPGRAATHVEVVVEFAVQVPALGKPLPGRFARRALAPAEALSLVALLAGALDEALGAGYSHGWISGASAWNLRRRACLVDLASGLARLDTEPIEMAAQVSGYYAPERIAGGGASEPADVFALGWLLYAALVGQANLDGYYRATMATGGSLSTAELLALWRERSREHVRTLLEADSALAVLLLGALAERPSERPSLAEFQAGAAEAGRGLAGVAALVAFVPEARAGAKSAAGVVAGAAIGAAAGVIAGAALAEAEAAAVDAPTADTATATTADTSTSAETASSAPTPADATSGAAVAAAGVAGLAAGAVVAAGLAEEASAGAGLAAGTAGEAVGGTGAAASAAVGSAGAVGGAAGAVGGTTTSTAVGGADVVGSAAGAAGAVSGTATSTAVDSASVVGGAAGAVGGATTSTEVGSTGAVGGATDAVGGAATSTEVGGAGLVSGAVETGGVEGVAVESGSVPTSAHHRRGRPRVGTGMLVGGAVVLLAIGLGSGYAFGSAGSGGGSAVVADVSRGGSSGSGAIAAAACAPSAKSSSAVVVAAANAATVAAASASASASAAASPTTASTTAPATTAASAATTTAAAATASAGWNAGATLPVPTSTPGAVAQLTEIVQGGESSGLLSSGTAATLRGEITAIQHAITTGSGYIAALEQLSQTIQSGQSAGTIPQNLSVQLATSLSYLYGSTGS